MEGGEELYLQDGNGNVWTGVDEPYNPGVLVADGAVLGLVDITTDRAEWSRVWNA